MSEDDNLTDEEFAALVQEQCNPAAKRIAELERENTRLQMELDASCNAEELRQVRAENARLRDTVKTLAWLPEPPAQWSDADKAAFTEHAKALIADITK